MKKDSRDYLMCPIDGFWPAGIWSIGISSYTENQYNPRSGSRSKETKPTPWVSIITARFGMLVVAAKTSMPPKACLGHIAKLVRSIGMRIVGLLALETKPAVHCRELGRLSWCSYKVALLLAPPASSIHA
jgi:hypothetical protein